MFELSNGHKVQFVVASGGLGFDGLGWPWEWPLRWTGLIRPRLFTAATKTLTLNPDPGYFRWWKPRECFRLIPGGAVNKFGLGNLGLKWWCKKIGPLVNAGCLPPLIVSIWGDEEELRQMARALNEFDLEALEVNVSCPNRAPLSVREAVSRVLTVKSVSRFPILVKVSVAQDYCGIASKLRGIAEGISLNSVPWEIAFPDERSPLWRLQERVGGGGGGVSGLPAQKFNWHAVRQLAKLNAMSVIAPSIMEYADLAKVDALKADAYSFGVIHVRTPWQPTQIALRWLAEHQQL